jgi:serine/threonine-protein kinase
MPDVITRLNAALEGRYRIERELGAGGMATVYLAEDVRHQRKVAVKVLRPELAAVVGADRFLAEIKTTANLQHPHILPLFDSGEADTFLFYVMPYVEGETLRGRLDREKQLPVDEALGIATAIAHALQTAHDQGVIHRDIKPGNILLSRGQALVADFGIAIAVGKAGGGRLTETGLSLGTPFYMSPEQATGDQVVGVASDVYAVGCVLYEMLVGDPPFSGSTAQAVLGKIIQGVPVSATAVRKAVPRNVDAAIRKALEKVPADRFARADEFAKALADPRFRHGELDTAVATARAGVWKPLALATTVSTLALAGVVSWLVTRPAPPLPVERFESPFRVGQEPVGLGPAGYRLSPDGSMVVYRGPGPEGTGDQLWVRRWDDPEATPVRGTEGGSEPSVSPDGREVVFLQDGEMHALALEGGPTRALGPGVVPRLQPDGYVYFHGEDGNAMRVVAAGGAAELVSETEEGEARRFVMQVLPGGRGALLGVQRLDLEYQIRALDLETGESTLLATGVPAAYSETGHLVYLTEGALMAAPFDANTMQLAGAAVPLVDGVLSFSLSIVGDLAYAVGTAGTGATAGELVWLSRTGEVTAVEEGWSFDAGAGNAGWSLSPDGTRVALRHRSDGNNDIWIKELPAGPFRRLTFDEQEQRVPFWTPDGTRVTYFSTPVAGSGAGDIWWSRADGTGQPELILAAEPGYAQGTWSPDGTELLLRTAVLATGGATPGARDIHRLRPGLDSATVPLLATSQYAEQDPRVSPDGRWLAYSSNETGRNEIFVRPFPDVEAGKVQVSVSGGETPFWSRDGREMFYVDAAGNLAAVRFEAGSTFRVTTQGPLFAIPPGIMRAMGSNTIDVAPDGQRFLMGRSLAAAGVADDADAPRLTLVKNFAEELRRRVPR